MVILLGMAVFVATEATLFGTLIDAAEDESELRDMTRRMWVAAAFTLPLLVVAMGPMLGLTFPHGLGHGSGNWIELVLATLQLRLGVEGGAHAGFGLGWGAHSRSSRSPRSRPA